MIISLLKNNIFFSFLSFDVIKLDMPLSCDTDGTKCKKTSSKDTGDTMSTDIIVGLTLGSIACLIFVIFIIIIMYMLCGKRYFRNRFHGRSRLQPVLQNQRQLTNINRDQQQQQQPPLDSLRSSQESSPSYEETNIKANISLNNNN